MKTEINPDGTSFVGNGSLTHKLARCRFCGAAAGEVRDDQIEFDSWVASIDCNECDATLTIQFSMPSPEEAIAAVVAIWNGGL
ncbi:conserved hypothetical protein [Paraburkholderia caribensis]|uniref:hypothetical protein n=1 Tax=Paraburkholderia caribensis TaxID=75105 RepID=UPI001CB10A9C|nr:hypothetical protein [Paraburkholderia caribensis]CAG9194121.1 conserved hypothetical protein [Paraburkholderia caribensis]